MFHKVGPMDFRHLHTSPCSYQPKNHKWMNELGKKEHLKRTNGSTSLSFILITNSNILYYERKTERHKTPVLFMEKIHSWESRLSHESYVSLSLSPPFPLFLILLYVCRDRDPKPYFSYNTLNFHKSKAFSIQIHGFSGSLPHRTPQKPRHFFIIKRKK